MQLWATWLLYAVLVDLTDAVAEALERPMAHVSWRWSIAASISLSRTTGVKPPMSLPTWPPMPEFAILSVLVNARAAARKRR
ncbi:MAG: hypothetical protein IPP10_15920 [Candidatus Competibacteraceae bacterium]|nr:hypothetical protein [Candidatus Competibacteraceae bacterium]